MYDSISNLELEKLLDRQPIKVQRVVRMHLAGHDKRDIARQLGKSTTTIRKWLQGFVNESKELLANPRPAVDVDRFEPVRPPIGAG